MQKGQATSPSISPGDSGVLHLSLPIDASRYDALVLVAKDRFKKEIYKWTWKISNNRQLLTEMMRPSDAAASVVDQDSVYMLTGGENTIWINKKDGLLVTTKNAAMDHLSFRHGPISVQGMQGRLASAVRSYQDGKDAVVECRNEGALHWIKWTMQGNGWVKLEYEYSLDGEFPFAGVSFDYPENDILGVKWLGKGPYHQWKNRMAGTPVNVWQKLYNNTQTSYSPIFYPEFKGYYGDITWMEFNTVEGKFYVASEDPGLFVRLFDFYGLTSAVRPFPDLPKGNISFLDCIPPIGTKLALNINYNTAALGPQSELTKIAGPVRRTLYFYFGLPKRPPEAQ
jgi:hypothetical protein